MQQFSPAVNCCSILTSALVRSDPLQKLCNPACNCVVCLETFKGPSLKDWFGLLSFIPSSSNTDALEWQSTRPHQYLTDWEWDSEIKINPKKVDLWINLAASVESKGRATSLIVVGEVCWIFKTLSSREGDYQYTNIIFSVYANIID